MTNDDLEAYFKSLGWRVETLQPPNGGNKYIAVRDYIVPTGNKADSVIDLAVEYSAAIPYVMPSAIHTRPVLVPMGSNNTQASPLGPDWQYWSRTLRGQPTPQRIVSHIATIFSEV